MATQATAVEVSNVNDEPSEFVQEMRNIRRRLQDVMFVPVVTGTFFDNNEAHSELAKFAAQLKVLTKQHDDLLRKIGPVDDKGKVNGIALFRKPGQGRKPGAKSVDVSSMFD